MAISSFYQCHASVTRMIIATCLHSTRYSLKSTNILLIFNIVLLLSGGEGCRGGEGGELYNYVEQPIQSGQALYHYNSFTSMLNVFFRHYSTVMVWVRM